MTTIVLSMIESKVVLRSLALLGLVLLNRFVAKFYLCVSLYESMKVMFLTFCHINVSGKME